jgi:hypothetical protein
MKFELVSPWGLESNSSTFIEGDTLEEACKGMCGFYLKPGEGVEARQVLEAQEIEVEPFMESENVWVVTGWANITDKLFAPMCHVHGEGKCPGHEVGRQMIFQELAIEVK